ncbi:type II methionyl aminopeptidase [Candidatus Mancarchaeum acidiphilum]|nr:type II methionyl aminopeptidase [Candidatus Mancarchaeum acidiphilum]
MDKSNLDNTIEEDENLAEEVCKISYEALLKARDMIKPGVKLLDVAEATESYVIGKGYEVAFPLNLSIDNEAAHYTPSYMDDKVFGEKDLVKVDFGAAKNGYLGDCALTVDLSGEYGKLVDATKEALENAVSIVRAGRKVKEIGKEINSTFERLGFRPIENLGGHGVNLHELHAEPFIPNYDNGDDAELEEGRRIAIEPFATLKQSRGLVTETDVAEIYSFSDNISPRLPAARHVLSSIMEKYPSEPFAARWLSEGMKSKFELYSGIRELEKIGALDSYPVLAEVSRGMVAQTEFELLVEKDSCKVLTKI